VGPEVAYAVHTRTCTYLLDDGGVCKWIISPTGMVPADIRQCIGAQFVACLDLTQDGGLAGELLLGAAALFVKHDPETRRSQLLRTGMIVQVETRDGQPAGELAPVSRGGDTVPPPPGFDRPASLREISEKVLDVSESTVTLTLPLYRPESQRRSRLPPPPPLPPPTLPEEARPTVKGMSRGTRRP
jgi:ribosome-associated protein YbcJ (S4-like RNA binding protein)